MRIEARFYLFRRKDRQVSAIRESIKSSLKALAMALEPIGSAEDIEEEELARDEESNRERYEAIKKPTTWPDFRERNELFKKRNEKMDLNDLETELSK